MNPASSSSGRRGQHAVTPPQGKPERKGNTPDGPSAVRKPHPDAQPADGKPQRRLADKVLRDAKHRPGTRRERMQILQALSSSAILAIAHRSGLAQPMLRDLTAFEKLVGEINRLGESLKGEVPANLAESLTERVIKVLAASTAINTGVLTYPLTDLLGGQDMSAQRVEGLVRQLLSAQERVAGEALLMSLRGVFGVLGGSHLSRPHRQAAVTAGLAAIDAAQEHDRVYMAGALLNAITHADEPQSLPPATFAGSHAGPPTPPAATTAHGGCHDDPAAQAHLQALVNDIVSPDLPGSLVARQAMLRALAFLVHAHHAPAEAGPAYIDLLASAPAFNAPLYSSVARGLPMELLLGSDDPQSAQALASLTAYARRLATWAAHMGAADAQALGRGFYEQLWIDMALSGPQFGAALRGMLGDDTSPLDAPSAQVIAGFLQAAIGDDDRLDVAQIEAFLDIADGLAPPGPGTASPARLRGDLGSLLGRALEHELWPSPHVERFIAAVLARAGSARWPPAWVREGGIWIGDCLRSLEPEDPLFTRVFEQLATTPLQAGASLLVDGFVEAQAISVHDTHPLDAILQVLAQPRHDAGHRGAILACQVAVTLGLHEPHGRHGQALDKCFRAIGLAAPRVDPLALGLALAREPVQTALAGGRRSSDAVDLFEAACTIDGLIDSPQRLQAIATQLCGPARSGAPNLRADLLLVLFLHRGHLVDATTMQLVRGVLASEAADLPAAPTLRVDGKGVAGQPLTPRQERLSQLEALYRYYVSASRFPFISLLADPQVVRARIASVESAMNEEPGRVLPEEREMIAVLRKDYAEHLTD